MSFELLTVKTVRIVDVLSILLTGCGFTEGESDGFSNMTAKFWCLIHVPEFCLKIL